MLWESQSLSCRSLICVQVVFVTLSLCVSFLSYICVIGVLEFCLFCFCAVCPLSSFSWWRGAKVIWKLEVACCLPRSYSSYTISRVSRPGPQGSLPCLFGNPRAVCYSLLFIMCHPDCLSTMLLYFVQATCLCQSFSSCYS